MAHENTVLCVDDDADAVELLRMMFKYEGFLVISAMTSEDGLRYAKEGGFAAIILDNKLPDYPGTDLCSEIKEFDSQTPIIFFTASALERDRVECLSAGAQAYLTKPEDIDRIADVVTQLINSANRNIRIAGKS